MDANARTRTFVAQVNDVLARDWRDAVPHLAHHGVVAFAYDCESEAGLAAAVAAKLRDPAQTRGWLLLPLSLLIPIVLSGCPGPGSVPIHRWGKPNTAEEQFYRDRYACLQEARTPVSSACANQYAGSAYSGVQVSQSMFDACMAARGYTRNDSGGQFGPPPGGVVYMH